MLRQSPLVPKAAAAIAKKSAPKAKLFPEVNFSPRGARAATWSEPAPSPRFPRPRAGGPVSKAPPPVARRKPGLPTFKKPLPKVSPQVAKNNI